MATLNLEISAWKALRSAALRVPEGDRDTELKAAIDGLDAVILVGEEEMKAPPPEPPPEKTSKLP